MLDPKTRAFNAGYDDALYSYHHACRVAFEENIPGFVPFLCVCGENITWSWSSIEKHFQSLTEEELKQHLALCEAGTLPRSRDE